MKHILLSLYALCALLVSLNAQPIEVNTQDGEMFILDIDPKESIESLQDEIAFLFDEREKHITIEVPSSSLIAKEDLQAAKQHGKYLGHPRDYHVPPAQQDKNDIEFIVNTLANRSLLEIATCFRKDLEARGDRIDHIHPLRFLEVIFTDEKLKVGIRNIRNKGWLIWSQFIGGLKESLSTESGIGNMPDTYLDNFATLVKIDLNLIYDSFANRRWEEFIDLLILHIPRNGDQGRYDF